MRHKDLLEYGIIKPVIKYNVKQKICLFKLSMCKNMIRNTVLENIISTKHRKNFAEKIWRSLRILLTHLTWNIFHVFYYNE